jgi:XTP/dITP diphosphohydrolase
LADLAGEPVPSSLHGERLLDVVRVMARLRAPGGCPWDAEQTHQTLARHLLEEAHELLEAIESQQDDAIRDELGDVLLQVIFHARIAADDGRWDIDDVADGLARKLIHRHPHVFAGEKVTGAEQVLTNWEKLKVTEGDGQRKGLEDGIPPTLPALARASKVQRRAAGWGFVPSTDDATRSLAISEVVSEGSIGRALFALVTLARARGIDAETALRAETRRFTERYEHFEAVAAERGLDLDTAGEAELRALAAEVFATDPEHGSHA